MNVLMAILIIEITNVLSFIMGRLFERLFGKCDAYMYGWSRGFDDGMAFAKENKEYIDDYKGKGVWAK